MIPERGDPRCHRFSDWEAVAPGIVAGITAVPEGDGVGSGSDFGLKTGGALADVLERYGRLLQMTGMERAVVARQVHGTVVRRVESPLPSAAHVAGEADGLVTSSPGLLLAATAADCVPVFIADVRGRCIGLVHAGWRGTAAGILERGIEALKDHYDVPAADLSVFLGPAICGSCYEVGTEVLRALGRQGDAPACVDLRSELAAGAVAAGIPAARVARSGWCTRCGPERFHSHRASGAGAGRMAAFLGISAAERAEGSGPLAPGIAATAQAS